MDLKVTPLSRICGTIDLPASKSYSIRAFFVATCGGVSRILGSSDCDDAKVAMAVAKALGAKVNKIKNGFMVDATGATMRSAGRKALALQVNESGTSLRFLLPLLPFYAPIAIVEGRGTLVGRPNHHLCQTLRECGLKISGTGKAESVPVRYEGGQIAGGRITIDGSVSSQFISALMIAAPRAGRDTRLCLEGKGLVSQDYVVMTRQILERAGIRVNARSKREFVIPASQDFRGLKNFCVPSDYGLAAFWMVAAALVPSRITLKGYFDDRLIQSDGAIIGLLQKMGVGLSRTGRAIRIQGPISLKGGTFSLKTAPDLVPIMAVAAMFAKGPTRLVDIAHARVKESDRISDLRHELLKVGADIREKKGELVIHPRPEYRSGAVLDPHHDHRLAMAFAVLGLRVGLTVKDVECTSKSYPGFVKALRSLKRI